MENKIQKKPRKNPNTDIQRLIDRVFNSEYGKYMFDDVYCDFREIDELYNDEELISSLSKKATEISTYKAIKNNKNFQAELDKLIKNMAQDALLYVKDAKKQIEQNKKYEEKQRIQYEKYAEKLKAIEAKQAEKVKKEKAQLAIFTEGLTSSQKRGIKKFFKVDVDGGFDIITKKRYKEVF